MKTILLTNRYFGDPLRIVREELPVGFNLLFLEDQTEDSLFKQIREADYLLAGGRIKVTAATLQNAEHLKMIQRSGAGLDSLDLDAIKEKGIPLYVNKGVNAESVAEHALLLILACLRHLTVIHQNTMHGIWRKQEQGVQTAELRGKTVGIIGMGNSGQALVRLLQPFHVTILYNSHNRKNEMEIEFGIHFVPLKELLQRSDVVSLHCALNNETRGIINSESLQIMKTGAALVNTARGGLVDTRVLAQALKSGKLSFAGIDVHEKEPISEDCPLKELENVILTPHIAGVTEDSFRAMMCGAFRNIQCFDQGRVDEIAPYRYL